MAPVRTITKDCFTKIRKDVESSAVSILQYKKDQLGADPFIGSGFVYSVVGERCIVLTVSRNLSGESQSKDMRTCVRFGNGHTFEGDIICDDTESKLAAIMVRDLDFCPVEVQESYEEALVGEPVVHLGFFCAEYGELNLSSGSVGLTGYDMSIDDRSFTCFAHCCSSKSDHIGGPVFNLMGKFVGVNYSKRIKRNIFFAFNIEQYKKELEYLFGRNVEDGVMRCFLRRKKRKHR